MISRDLEGSAGLQFPELGKSSATKPNRAVNDVSIPDESAMDITTIASLRVQIPRTL